MKHFFYLLTISFFVLASCKEKTQVKQQESKRFSYAKWVDILQKDGYQLLIIKNPKTGKVEQEFCLVEENNKPVLPKNAQQIQVPVNNLAALSVSFVGAFQTLDALEVIRATSSKQFIYNKKIVQRIDAGEVIPVDYESGLSPESCLKSGISVILYSGFGQPYPNQDKLAQLGVICMPIYDWEEVNPLGKAEWIKVFGVLVGKEKLASQYFNQIEREYKQLKIKAAEIKHRKKVLCGSLLGDIWYTPAGGSYFAKMLNDAGFDYVYKDSKGTASLAQSMEQIIKDEQKCEVWINAEASDLRQLYNLNGNYRHFNTVSKGSVYSYTTNANYYWEYSQVNPHWLLKDLVQIATGDTVSPLHFYKKIN
jgi:iron complex transport system substrate-binding protein